jgi:hypothetical protein
MFWVDRFQSAFAVQNCVRDMFLVCCGFLGSL